MPNNGTLQANPSRGALRMRAWRAKNLEKSRAYMKARLRERRTRALSHYGGKCSCCGEDSFEFLALDHIKGGGEEHTNAVGGGSRMVDWILKNDFPPIFRVLCHNCNMAIGFYGRCPHEEQRVLYLVS